MRARAGDRRARTALVRRHQRAVFHLLGRMFAPAGLEDLVEDVAQETFLRALRALDGFDPNGTAKFSTWLLTIASRLAINALKRRRLRTEPIEGFVDRLAGPTTAEDHDRRHRVARAIAIALEGLAPPYRAAFLLHEFHGLDAAEIAVALEIEPGTVKSRLSRARAALRRSLQGVRDDD